MRCGPIGPGDYQDKNAVIGMRRGCHKPVFVVAVLSVEFVYMKNVPSIIGKNEGCVVK